MNSPADIFGIIFYIIRKISDLILGNALEPIDDQLQHSDQTVNDEQSVGFASCLCVRLLPDSVE